MWYYFGCHRRAGHYLFDENMRHVRRCGRSPWTLGELDGSLCFDRLPNWPRWKTPDYQPEGVARINYKDGWAALSFWDRSVDKRGGCNSNFLVDETLDFDEMLIRSQEAFPKIFARYTFEITKALKV